MVYYPSYRTKKRFGNFNKKNCKQKQTKLTIAEEFAIFITINGTGYSITFNQKQPINSTVIYNNVLIGKITSHDNFKKSGMKIFSSACCTNCTGAAGNMNYEKSEIIIPYNRSHENISVFYYDEQNTQNNGWNCYKNIIINGKTYRLLKIEFI